MSTSEGLSHLFNWISKGGHRKFQIWYQILGINLFSWMLLINQKMYVIGVCEVAGKEKKEWLGPWQSRKRSGWDYDKPIRLIQTKCKAVERVLKGKTIRLEGAVKMEWNLIWACSIVKLTKSYLLFPRQSNPAKGNAVHLYWLEVSKIFDSKNQMRNG